MNGQTMASRRYDRNIRLLGEAGQDRIEASLVAVIGLGGLGSHVVQQLAYLGVQRLLLIDNDVVDETNLNRLVGATPDDALAHRAKTEVATRAVRTINPDASAEALRLPVGDPRALDAVRTASVIVGCVDNDSARLTLTELASRNSIPYLDAASDAGETDGFLWYGGRVVTSHKGLRCLSCCQELDQDALRVERMTDEQRRADREIYGVDRSVLGVAGPSVVSINGVVASLAVTEFVALVTGLREPIGHLVYHGHRGIVTTREDPDSGNCYYCSTIFGADT